MAASTDNDTTTAGSGSRGRGRRVEARDSKLMCSSKIPSEPASIASGISRGDFYRVYWNRFLDKIIIV
jgi:hypothetical protein